MSETARVFDRVGQGSLIYYRAKIIELSDRTKELEEQIQKKDKEITMLKTVIEEIKKFIRGEK